MAWTTADLIEKTRKDLGLRLVIRYGRDDAPETVTVTETFSPAPVVSAVAKATLDRLNALLVADQALTLGPITVATGIPTQDEADRATFLAAQVTLRRLQRAVAAGLLRADDASVSAAESAYKAAFKPGYEGLVLP